MSEITNAEKQLMSSQGLLPIGDLELFGRVKYYIHALESSDNRLAADVMRELNNSLAREAVK